MPSLNGVPRWSKAGEENAEKGLKKQPRKARAVEGFRTTMKRLKSWLLPDTN